MNSSRIITGASVWMSGDLGWRISKASMGFGFEHRGPYALSRVTRYSSVPRFSNPGAACRPGRVQPRPDWDDPLRIASGSLSLRLAQLGNDGTSVAEFDVPKDGCKIGRRVGDFVVADDETLSATHAWIVPTENGALEVRDLSTGKRGCWHRIRVRRYLQLGDAILFGRSAAGDAVPSSRLVSQPDVRRISGLSEKPDLWGGWGSDVDRDAPRQSLSKRRAF